ncbi:hypothetical protein BJV78DRAFT_312340 [Lactifluus subvellereus]|nr:hypothetical protein BJV78DRAFT_312340 [Lactifluus subvellereus]
MTLSDKALGGAMMAAAVTIFIYYTAWAILVPFFDASSPIHAWFPHENGLYAFLPSFWSLVYLRLEDSLGILLSKKTGSRRRKPSFGLHDVLVCTGFLSYIVFSSYY